MGLVACTRSPAHTFACAIIFPASLAETLLASNSHILSSCLSLQEGYATVSGEGGGTDRTSTMAHSDFLHACQVQGE